AYIGTPDALPQPVKEKTVYFEKNIAWFRFTTVSGLSVTLERDAAEVGPDGNGLPLHIGDQATVDLTITSEVDAYGFATALDSLAFVWDTDSLAADNPGTKVEADLTGDYPRLVWESDGVTKALEAGVPLTIKLRFSVKQTTIYALNANLYGNSPLTA